MMTMIKRVITIPRGIESLVDKINDFIKNDLKENEYVIDIKYIGNETRFKLYGKSFETVVVAIVHIGEVEDEME